MVVAKSENFCGHHYIPSLPGTGLSYRKFEPHFRHRPTANVNGIGYDKARAVSGYGHPAH